MAFPYTTITNFEDGTDGSFFTVETDANGGVDFPHYRTLAQIPGTPMPWRGAYLMRVNLATTGTDSGYIQDVTNLLMTAGTDAAYIKVKFFVTSSLTMANNDTFNLIDFRSGADVSPHTDGTAEAVCAIKYTTAAGVQIGIGETSATSLMDLTLDEWHDIELLVDPAGGAAGTIDAWLDGTAMTQVGSLTQSNITAVAVGVVGQDAGTTAGTIYIDHIIGHLNGARIGGPTERFPEQLLLEASAHAFVGSGVIDNVSLYSGAAADNILRVWDTDIANTTSGNLKLVLKNLSADETPVDPAGVPITVAKGCYVQLTGTNPRGMLQLRRAIGYGSDGAIRNHAHR